jgi:hypothetical protein
MVIHETLKFARRRNWRGGGIRAMAHSRNGGIREMAEFTRWRNWIDERLQDVKFAQWKQSLDGGIR